MQRSPTVACGIKTHRRRFTSTERKQFPISHARWIKHYLRYFGCRKVSLAKAFPSVDRSRGAAGHQAFRLHRTVGNIASKPNAHSPRKTAAALSVVVRARAVGRWGAFLKNQSENPDCQKHGRDKHERRTDRDGSASGYFGPVHRCSRPRRPDPRTADAPRRGRGICIR